MRVTKKYSAMMRKGMLVMVAIFSLPSVAFSLPQNGVVSGGDASIVNGVNQIDINQSSDRAIIDWSSFDVNANEKVQFNQPSSSSVTLNRIGGQNPSSIKGTIKANGKVILANPNGVIFSDTAQVDVGSMVVTSANISNTDFMNGNMKFDQAGNPNAVIRNEGNITISDTGLAAFVAPNVSNSGVITARLGKVQLAGGETFTLDLYGDGLINVTASPQMQQAIVSNSGRIVADGGSILMTASDAAGVMNGQINMSGTLQANSIGTKNGRIVIYASGSNAVAGNVTANKGQASGTSTAVVSGTISATGMNPGEKGGEVEVLADHVALLDGTIIDVSGDLGGGIVHIGGAYHGEGITPTALDTFIDSNVVIRANAITNGNGGFVTAWADQYTYFGGAIEAMGGLFSGDGGFVETSGAEWLSTYGGSVNAHSPTGQNGIWLLDPNNATISTSATSNPGYSSTWTAGAGGGNVNVTDIVNSLNGGTSVTITASGTITVASTINANLATGPPTLTLKAGTNIYFNAGVSINSASGKPLNVVLNAGTALGTGSITMGDGVTSGTAITTYGGNITLGGGANPATTAAIGDATYIYGIVLNKATLDAGGGNISMRGTGGNNSTNYNVGVYVAAGSSVTTSGSGTITMVGTGGGNSSSTNNWGVAIANSTVTTQNGAISITGNGGGGSGGFMYGVYVNQSTVETTGTGALGLTGTGTGTGNNAVGVLINSSSIVRSTQASSGGAINLVGVGSQSGTTATTHYGVQVDAATVTSVSGDVTVTGVAGSSTGGSSSGVAITNTGKIESTGTAGITIVGTAVTNSYGIVTSGGTNTIGGSSASGTVHLVADSVSFATNTNIQTSGAMIIRPYTANYGVSVGASVASTLNISDTYLGYLNWGSSSILYIGGTTTAGASGGTLTINTAFSWTKPVMFVSASGYNITFATTTFTTSSDLTTDSGQDLIINKDITESGTSKTFNLKAKRNVLIGTSGAVTIGSATGKPLTITLNADSTDTNGSSTGAVVIGDSSNTSYVKSFGGNITIGGGTTPSTMKAIGNASYISGVSIDKATIDASDGNSISGNISILGAGYSAGTGSVNFGVYFAIGSTITTTASGTITLVGNGGGTGASSLFNYGLDIAGVINSINGAITLTGTGGTSSGGTNIGVSIEHDNVAINVTGSGTVTITGIDGSGSSGSGINIARFNTYATPIGGASASGDITLITDNLVMYTNTNIQTSGNILIKPYTAAKGVSVGSSVASTLNISDTYLGYLNWGSSSQLYIGGTTIGNATAGAITINTAFSWTKPVTFVNASGYDITFTTTAFSTSSNLTTDSGQDLYINKDITESGTSKTFNLKAKRNILIGTSGAVTVGSATGKPLTITLNSDSTDTNGSSTGAVVIGDGTNTSYVKSFGGNITIGGGTTPSTMKAIGNATYVNGVNLNKSTIDATDTSVGGNIIINGSGYTGTASANNNGVIGQAGAVVKTNNSGTLTVAGVGGGNASSNTNVGIYLTGTNSLFQVQNGAMTLTGNGGTGGQSMGTWVNTGAMFETTGTGALNINGFGTSTNGGSYDYGVYVVGTIRSTASSGGGINIIAYGGGHGTTAQFSHALVVEGGTISTVDGNIDLKANTGNGSYTISTATGTSGSGLVIVSNSSITSTGTGTITGVAYAPGAGTTSSRYGIYIDGSTINSYAGAISFTGTGGSGSGGTNTGFYLATGSTVGSVGAGGNTTGTANISITGIAGSGTSDGIVTVTGTNTIGGAYASGTITLTGDTLNLAASTTIRTTGDIVIKPYTTGRGVSVGSSVASTLNISDTYLGYLNWGSSSTLYVGGTTIAGATAGATTVNTAFSWTKPVTFVTASGYDITFTTTTFSTSSNLTTDSGQDLIINKDITESGTSKTFNLKAKRSILIGTSGAVTVGSATGKPLTITLNSDSTDTNGTLTGTILIGNGTNMSYIYSYGGNITMGGGTSPSTMNAIGLSDTYRRGVELNKATVDASDGASISGNILMNGKGYASGTSNGNIGVLLRTGSVAKTTNTGTITMNGTGGGGTGSLYNYGVDLQTSSVTAATGTIALTGVGGTGTGGSNHGVAYEYDSGTLSTTSGAITLTGTAGSGSSGYSIMLAANSTATLTLGGASTSGDITLVGDSMIFYTYTNVQTTGNIIIKPLTQNYGVSVGSSVASTLNISTTMLGYLNWGSSSQLYIGGTTIGNATAGAITINTAFSWTKPVTFVNASGYDITFTTTTFSTSSNLTTDSGQDLYINKDITETGTSKTFNLKAKRNVLIGTTGAVTVGSATGKSLTITINSDSTDTNGSLTGYILVGDGTNATSILSYGGAITMGGGTSPSTMNAIGIAGSFNTSNGIRIYKATVDTRDGNSTGGNIIMRGLGSPSATTSSTGGVNIYGTSHVATGGAGTITIYGTSGGTGASSNNNAAVYVETGSDVIAYGSTGTIYINATGGSTGSEATGTNPGLALNGSVTANGGSITLIGSGSASSATYNPGVGIGGTVSNSGTGTISITGTGGGSGSSNGNYGVQISGGTISSGSGLITITGTGGAGSGGTNNGIQFGGGGDVTSTSGGVTLIGTAGSGSSYGIRLANASGTVVGNGSGDITIQTDNLSLANSASITTTGNTIIKPLTQNYGVSVGSSVASTLNIDDTGLGYLSWGSSNNLYIGGTTIGNATAGAITVNTTYTPTKPVTFVNASGYDITFTTTAFSTSSDLTTDSGNDLFINKDITETGTSKTFNLKAKRNIVVAGGVTIGSATGKPLAITLNSDSTDTNGSLSGAIKIGDGVTASYVKSFGGAITLGGGTTPSTMAARGNSTIEQGVYLFSATIDATDTSVGGNIIVSGTGYASSTVNAAATSAHGILMNGGTIQTNNSGTIAMTGIGGGTTGAGSVNGLYVYNGSTVWSVNGNTTITGTGGNGTAGSNNGIAISGTGTNTVKSTGTGSLTLTGTGGGASSSNSGIINNGSITSTGGGAISLTGTAGAGTSVGLTLASAGSASTNGNITLKADSITLSGGIRTTANIIIQPKTSGTSMGIGTSSSGTLTLSDTYLGYLVLTTPAGIYFGGTSQADATAGAMNINVTSTPYNFTVPITFVSASGYDITFAGALSTSSNLTTDSGQDLYVNANLTETGTSKTFNLKAKRNVLIGTTGAVTVGSATGKPLTITLNSDSTDTNGSSTGVIAVGNGTNTSYIYSYGGNITMGGGTAPSTMSAIGTSSYQVGVNINKSTIDASDTSTGGTIVITGTGYSTAGAGTGWGVVAQGGAIIKTNNSGALTVTGTGGGSNGAEYGVYITDSGTDLQVANNTLTLTGTGANTGSGSNQGVRVATSAIVETVGSGNIVITGNGAGTGSTAISGNGVVIVNATVRSTAASSGGNITITGTATTGSTSGSLNLGVNLNNGTVSNTSGTITVTGTGGTGSGGSNNGINMQGTAPNITSLSSAAVTITGIAGSGTSYGIATSGTTNTFGGGSAAGTLTVKADSLSLGSGTVFQTTGNIIVQPYTANYGVSVGSSVASTLNISDTYLGYLNWGSSAMLYIGGTTIGNATAGAITVNSAYTPTKPVTFVNASGYDITFTTTAFSTSSNLTTDSGQDLYVNANLTETGTSKTFNLKAMRNVRIGTTGAVTVGSATGKPLTITINSDSTDTNETVGGGVKIGDGTNASFIYSYGGDIVVGGGTSPSTMAAVGTSGVAQAVLIKKSTLDASDGSSISGNITIRGKGYAGTGNFNHGVEISNGSTIKTTNNGNISVYGVGGGTSTSSGNEGIAYYSTGTTMSAANGTITLVGTGNLSSSTNPGYGILVGAPITTTGGNINITGTGGSSTSGSDSYGIRFSNNGNVSTATGAITVIGTGGNASGGSNFGIYASSISISSTGSGTISITSIAGAASSNTYNMASTTIGGGSASGDITIISDSWSGISSATIQTTGNIIVKPYTQNYGVSVGASVASTLNISDTYLGYLNWGSSAQLYIGGTTIGNATAGTMTLNSAYTATKPVTFVNASGYDISFAGGTLASSSDINVNSGRDIITGGTGTATVTGSGNLYLTATRDINFAHDFDLIASGTGQIRLRANRSILYTNNGDITTQGGAITLNADRDDDLSGTISLVGDTTLTSNGGAISLVGGSGAAGYAYGSDSTNKYGIVINAAQLASGNGAIVLKGRGYGGAGNNNYGILITGSGQLASTGGNITLTGIGGAGAGDSNYGIEMESGLISTATGAISLTGTGGGSGADEEGVRMDGGIIETTGTGTITIHGDGSATGNSNRGVLINAATVRSTAVGGGGITIVGTGTDDGTGISGFGFQLSGNGSITSVDGHIDITGTGATSDGTNQLGAWITNATISSSGNADIDITGYAGGNSNSTNYFQGIMLSDSTISGKNGNTTLHGIGAFGTGGAEGIRAQGGSMVFETTGTGTLTLLGEGGNTGLSHGSNTGILLYSGVVVRSTNGGNIVITGTAGDSASGGSNGIAFVSNIAISAAAGGNVTITGVGDNGSEGINWTTGTQAVTAVSGDITLIADAIARDVALDISTGGNIVIKPYTANYGVSLGSSVASTLNLSNAFLGYLSWGSAKQLYIGGTTIANAAAGAITVDTTWAPANPVTLVNASGYDITLAGNLATGSDVIFNSGRDALINADITESGTGKTLTFKARRNVVMDGAQIDSSGSAVGVVMNSNSADTNNSGTGYVKIINSSVINSHGGNVTLGGGADIATGYAIGDTTDTAGVLIDNSNINVGSGAFSARGMAGRIGGVYATGIVVVNTTSYITATGAGTITLTGTASGYSHQHGVYINTYMNGNLSVEDGDMTITGTGGTSWSNGINLQNANLSSTGAGDIILNGTSGSDNGVGIETQFNNSITTSSTGNISLTGSSFYGIRLNNTTVVTSSGTGGGSITLDGTGTTGYIALELTHQTLSSVDGDIILNTNGSAPIYLYSDITATGAANIQFNGVLRLGYNAQITTDGGDISFANIIDSSDSTRRNFTAASAAGAVTFANTLGGVNPLADVSITSNDALALPTITADSIFARTTGAASDLTIASGVVLTASDTGTAITLVAKRHFLNQGGSGALVTSSGRWLVYTTNISNSDFDGLTPDFDRFSCTYGGSCPDFSSETGDGALYSYTPVLTATPDAIAHLTYGDAVPDLSSYAYSVSGYVGVSTGGNSGTLSGSTNYTQGAGVGTYHIDYSSGTLTSALGYSYTYANNNTAITVDKRAITVTANAQAHDYGFGGTSASLGTTGFSVTSGSLYNTDNISAVTITTDDGLSGASFYKATHGTGTPNADASLTPSNAVFDSGSIANYDITYADGALTVNQIELTITGVSATMVYNGSTSGGTITGTASFNGIKSGDTVTIDTSAAAATYDDPHVGAGNKNVNFSGYAMNASGDYANYYVTQPSVSNGSITQAAITVTADSGQSVVYGQNVGALTYTITSGTRYGSDNLGTLTTANGGAGTQAIHDNGFDVGNVAITSNLSNGDYDITYVGANLSVTAASITATANSGQSVTYGQNIGTLAYTITSGTRYGTDSLGTLSTANGGAGTQAIHDNGFDVGNVAITNTLSNGNYDITYVGDNLAVTAAPITVTANSGQSVVYGQNIGTLAYTVTSGTRYGTDNLGTLTTANGGAGTQAIHDNGFDVGNVAITSTLSNGNYDITYVGDNLAVTAAPITVTANSGQSVVYGNNIGALGYTVTSGTRYGTDSLGTLTTANGGAGTAATHANGFDVGNVAITSNLSNSNYTITYVGDNLAITARPITITGGITVDTRQYDNTTGATVSVGSVTFDDKVSGDNVGIDNSSYTASFADKHAANGISVTVSGLTLNGAQSGNYSLASQPSLSGNITPADITVTANSGQSVVYGQNIGTLAYTVTSGTRYGSDNLGTLTTANGGAGTQAIHANGFDVGNVAITSNLSNGDYDITYVGDNLAVTAAPITVTADSGQSVTYGQNVGTLTYQVTSGTLYSGDSFTGVLTTANGGAGTQAIHDNGFDVGNVAITSNLSNGNYDITYVGKNLAVTAASVTVTADSGQSVVYGQNVGALTYSVTSGTRYGTDSLGTLSTANGGAGTQAIHDNGFDVGNVAITNTLSNNNYDITYVGDNLAVTAAPITVTANSGQSVVYGNNIGALGYTVTSGQLYGNDAFTGALTTANGGAGTAATHANGFDVGNVAITSGLSNGNYDITYVGKNLAVTARPVTITGGITADNKYYDGTTAATLNLGSVTFSGKVTGDDLTIDTSTYSADFNDLHAGNNIDVIVSGFTLDGAQSGNYYLASQPSGTLTADIIPSDITVTADSGQSVVYGHNLPTLTYQITSGMLYNTDSLSGALTTAHGGAGTQAKHTNGFDVGNVAITSTLANADYNITYVGKNLAVTAAPITVTASSGQSMVYGSTIGMLGYSITSGTLYSGDSLGTLSTANGGMGTQAIHDNGFDVGNVAITNTLSNNNYDITYVGGNLAITAAPITVTANSGQSVVYGQNVGTLGYAITSGQLFGNDVFTGALSTANGGAGTQAIHDNGFDVGNTAITNGLTNGNYNITYVGKNLAVTAAPITVTANSGQSVVYGNNIGALGYTVTSGTRYGTDSLGTLTTAHGGAGTAATHANGFDVGNVAITSNLSNSNYTITYVGDNLAITARPVTITGGITANDKTYDKTNTATLNFGTPTFSSLVSGDDLSVNGSGYSAHFALSHAASGQVITVSGVTLGGAQAGNYSLSSQPSGITASINPVSLTVVADSKSKTYDKLTGTDPALTYHVNGVLSGESDPLSSISLSRTGAQNAGTYSITASGGSSSNTDYVIGGYTAGTFTINKATLTVTANNANRYYGDANGSFTGSITGFATGDNTSSLTTQPTYTTSATQASNVGTYSIVASGAAASNYNFSYVNGTYTINKATLTVAPVAATRTYGTAGSYTLTFSGFKNGQDSSVLGSQPYVVDATSLTSGIGTYAGALTATGAAATNYDFSYGSANLVINPATLTITADSKSRYVNELNPVLTGSISGFKNGETTAVLLSQPSYATAAIDTSPVGSYAITASGASAANYQLVYVNGTLVISEPPALVPTGFNNIIAPVYNAPNTLQTPAFTSPVANNYVAPPASSTPVVITPAPTPTPAPANTTGGDSSGGQTGSGSDDKKDNKNDSTTTETIPMNDVTTASASADLFDSWIVSCVAQTVNTAVGRINAMMCN